MLSSQSMRTQCQASSLRAAAQKVSSHEGTTAGTNRNTGNMHDRKMCHCWEKALESTLICICLNI